VELAKRCQSPFDRDVFKRCHAVPGRDARELYFAMVERTILSNAPMVQAQDRL
jgi:hypothetical protein